MQMQEKKYYFHNINREKSLISFKLSNILKYISFFYEYVYLKKILPIHFLFEYIYIYFLFTREFYNFQWIPHIASLRVFFFISEVVSFETCLFYSKYEYVLRFRLWEIGMKHPQCGMWYVYIFTKIKWRIFW